MKRFGRIVAGLGLVAVSGYFATRTIDAGRAARSADTGAHLYAIPATGGTPLALEGEPTNDELPALAPERRQVAFATDETENPAIWVTDVSGQRARQLTADFAQGDTYDTVGEAAPLNGIAWTPDGGSILFQRRVADDLDADAEEYNEDWHEIWEARVAAGQMTRLAKGNDISTPAVSPDGARVAYVVGTPEGQPNRLLVLRRSGKIVWRAPGGAGLWTGVFPPTWSPDGRLAVEDKNAIRTTLRTRAGKTLGTTVGCCVSWTRDSRRLAASGANGGGRDARIALGDGTRSRRVVRFVRADVSEGRAAHSLLIWSPDGSLLSLPDGRLVDVAKSRILALPAGTAAVAWARDGRLLLANKDTLFVARRDGTQAHALVTVPAGEVLLWARWGDGDRTVVYLSGSAGLLRPLGRPQT